MRGPAAALLLLVGALLALPVSAAFPASTASSPPTASTSSTASAASAADDPVGALAARSFELERGGEALVVRYEGTHPLGEPCDSVTRLVVMVHGILRNADEYHALTLEAHRARGSPGDVAILSPQFLTAADVVAHELDADVPYWTRTGWAAGDLSRSQPELPRAERISSFEVLDALLARAAESFPELRTVVVAGHSAGGQLVNRYAASNLVHDELEPRGIELAYVVANPSSYLYFCDNRPVSHDPLDFAPLPAGPFAACEGADRYRYGMQGLPHYLRERDPDSLPARYAGRRVSIFLGAADNDPEDRYLARGCAAMAQGAHRLERGIAYWHYLAFRFGPEVHERHLLEIVPDVAHSSRRMYTSPAGQRLLFGAKR